MRRASPRATEGWQEKLERESSRRTRERKREREHTSASLS